MSLIVQQTVNAVQRTVSEDLCDRDTFSEGSFDLDLKTAEEHRVTAAADKLCIIVNIIAVEQSEYDSFEFSFIIHYLTPFQSVYQGMTGTDEKHSGPEYYRVHQWE